MAQYILSLDQGTTSSRAILFGRDGRTVAAAQREFPQILPAPGLVEHDPEAIWASQLDVTRQALSQAGLSGRDIAAMGVTNQRETTILWERDTGRPVANAVVWQSRVSAPICERLLAEGLEATFLAKTGLRLDAYFSGTKIKHLLDTHDGLRRRAQQGEILFGTVDTWLIWRLTGGSRHVTDPSNASRTLIFNIHTLDWDDELLAILDIPRAMLPEVRPSSEVYGQTLNQWFGSPIPIAGDVGDQQAATFGQACFQPGAAKNTYGTGCFLLMNTGHSPMPSRHRLLTTIGWALSDGETTGTGTSPNGCQPTSTMGGWKLVAVTSRAVSGRITYCLEGSIFIGGAVVQWLRDGLGVLRNSADVEQLATGVPDAGGVYFVPAFVGLGAPHWDTYARGTILGITRGTTAAHLARAALESMAFQTRDVLEAMEKDSGIRLTELRVDGGASVNDLLMQFQADILGVPVRRPAVAETTALGAAYMAGLAVGYWNGLDDIARNWALGREYTPRMSSDEREARYARWREAVVRSLDWERRD